MGVVVRAKANLGESNRWPKGQTVFDCENVQVCVGVA